jgi:hypothetical protein
MKPKKKHPKKKIPQPHELRSRGWAVLGGDISMSSIAMAGIGYDATLKKLKGPEFMYLRWEKDDEYFDRLKEAANAHMLIEALLTELGLILNLDEIFIAQEEPWPVGMVMRGGASSWLKQQAEISGAFLGGLVRWGYTNVSQINSIRWRKMIADDLEITTHHSKWRSPELALQYNCKPSDSGKFRAKEWALNSGYAFQGVFPEEIPDWPDIISSKDGNKPRPEGSVAKAVQPDDRYDALAVMWTHYLELQELGLFNA